MTLRAKYNLSIGTLSLLVIIGIAALAYQLVNGLGVTGMNNVVSWGLYIIMFMFFVGLSAGGLIVSSSATVFDIPAFKVVAKPATILSTVCIIIAGLFIMVDLGSPFRVFNLILHSQFKSPLMWDVVVIGLYLIINVAYLYAMTRKQQNEKLLKSLSFVALPVAILVHSVTAWIFGLQIARDGWYSALMAPLFVASALDSGLALLIIVLALLATYKVMVVDKKLFTSLAGLLVTFVAVDLYLVFSEIVTMVYPQEQSTLLILNEMVRGSMAPFFWAQIVLGLLIPIAILIFRKNRERLGLVIFSSILVIVGVFFKRVWLLLTSFIYPNVDGSPGITLGSYVPKQDPSEFNSFWSTIGQYAPTMFEIIITVGLLALGTLMFIVLSRMIITEPKLHSVSDTDQQRNVQ